MNNCRLVRTSLLSSLLNWCKSKSSFDSHRLQYLLCMSLLVAPVRRKGDSGALKVARGWSLQTLRLGHRNEVLLQSVLSTAPVVFDGERDRAILTSLQVRVLLLDNRCRLRSRRAMVSVRREHSDALPGFSLCRGRPDPFLRSLACP